MSRRDSVIYFATSNPHKLEEAQTILGGLGIRVIRVGKDTPEVQSDSLEEIARTSVTSFAQRVRLKVFVEDAGLFVQALRGFPGPYSSYVHRTIGNGGLLKLLSEINDRSAEFRSAVAYSDEGGEPTVFSGKATGSVAHRERGAFGFGFDPIFVPDLGDGRTFGEMTPAEKSLLSHRADALRKLSNWLLTRS